MIRLKYVCRCSQTAGRNYCLIDSGDASTSDSTSSHEFACQFSLAIFLFAKNTCSKSVGVSFIRTTMKVQLDTKNSNTNIIKNKNGLTD